VDVIDPGAGVLACLADVHGNTAALDAVLTSADFARADAVAFLGCTTTGPDPLGVLDRCADLRMPVFHLAGNGERRVLEVASGTYPAEREVDRWLVAAHGADGLAAIGSWPGGLRVAHDPMPEAVLVHGHTHVQYRRDAIGKVITGAGSVGLPYAAGPGARWALVSDQVQLIVTPYRLDRAEALIASSGYPGEAYGRTLRHPPSPVAKTAEAEQLVFSN
jgi:predicted phosphodiesterase